LITAIMELEAMGVKRDADGEVIKFSRPYWLQLISILVDSEINM